MSVRHSGDNMCVLLPIADTKDYKKLYYRTFLFRSHKVAVICNECHHVHSGM